MDGNREYRFDGWVLRAQTGELLRDGRCIRLQRHPSDILELLLGRPGELVTRQELIERLWPRGVVEFDLALNSAIRRLRMALGDSADAPRYVETIPRRGYRFVGRVDPPVGAARDPPPAATPPDGIGSEASPRLGIAPHRLRRWSATALAAVALFATVGVGAIVEAVRGGPDRLPAKQAVNAEEPFARAEFFFQRRAEGDLERAQQGYDAALRVDGGMARAWAGLAGVHWIRTATGAVPAEEGLSKLRDAAERALALDPQIAAAHLRMANYRMAIGEPGRAAEHVRRALALEPNSALILGVASSLAVSEGHWDEAIVLQRQAVGAAAWSAVQRTNLAALLFLAGRPAEAGAEIQVLHEMFGPSDESRELEALIHLVARRCDSAMRLSEELPGGVAHAAVRAMALHCLGRAVDANAALQALVVAYGHEDPLRVAQIHAYRGEHDRAFEWLQEREPTGRVRIGDKRAALQPWMLTRSPLAAALHADPRWQDWFESRRNARYGG